MKHTLLEGAASAWRGALARLGGSVWLAPGAKAAAAVAGVMVLAAIGGSARAVPAAAAPVASALVAGSAAASPSTSTAPSSTTSTLTVTVASPASSAATSAAPTANAPSARATAEDPVILNSANTDDLRRLPAIGPKRAEAILALRAKIGRFHNIEELLRVKGIGRATLRRLRPLVRVDPAPATPGLPATASPTTPAT